jgi:hypothetical protein
LLAQLTTLTSFDLGVNELNGTMPESLGRLTRLTFLELGVNKLSGTVPDSLGQLTALTFLNLDSNPALCGKLPTLKFAQYTQCCALGGDNFSCPLPPGATGCTGGVDCSTKPPPTCH